MAKRKSKKANKQAPKKKMKLETVFNCPICSHVNSVECTIGGDRIGYVECNICKSGYETTVTDLTEPTDMFHECGLIIVEILKTLKILMLEEDLY